MLPLKQKFNVEIAKMATLDQEQHRICDPCVGNRRRTVQNATPSSEIASVGVGEVHLSADGDFEQQAL